MSTREDGTIISAPIVAGGDTDDDIPSAIGSELQGAAQHFTTITKRDEWASKYKSRLFRTWCLVDADDNGFSQWYEWTGTKEDGTDGDWQELNAVGVVMSDSAGAIPKNIKTVVFGPGFAIQQAGDQEDAALVTYSGSSDGGSPLSVGQSYNPYNKVDDVTEIETFWPIEVDQARSGPQQPNPGVATLSINPGAYESQHSNGCLLGLDMVTSISGQDERYIYMNREIVPTGTYYNLNSQEGGVDVQDNTGGDTAVTGGQLTEALVKVAFLDQAPTTGTVKVWLEYKDPSDPVDKKILVDVNGNPMAVERLYNASESLGELLLSGAFMAKATQALKVMIETSFDVSDKVTIDPQNTMICLNQFSNGYETSLARIEFLRRAAVQITPAIQKFSGGALALIDEMSGVTKRETTISAGQGYDTLNEFGLQNLTDVKVSILNDEIRIRDTGTIADFYFDMVIDNVQTQMLRGREITSHITVKNPQNSFEFEAYKWVGKPDDITQVYSTRSNDSIVINTGWEVVKGLFISELASGDPQSHTLTFTVPDDANNVVILVRPSVAQSPINLTMSVFNWGTSTSFTGYAEIIQYNQREEHLRFDETFAEFFLNTQGYKSIRYTINNAPATGNPMPVGVLAKGKAPVERDGTVNQVPGSTVPQFDGAIKFLKDGEASISHSYNVRNETGTDSTVTFWDVLIDVDGNETKIDDSEKTVTITANTGAPGTIITIPAYAYVVEAGQRIGSRAMSNKADGAYVQSDNISEYVIQTTIDFKELVPDQGDVPDLVTIPFNRLPVVDRRVVPFSGVSASTFVISDFTIPADVKLANCSVVSISGDITASSDNPEFSYNAVAKTLTVHIGTTTDGEIYLEFWG